MTHTPRILEGTRVLDLSRFIAGPLCGQYLADLGAEVIKVEPPAGEPARSFAARVGGESLYTMLYNGGKRGATLNFRHREAPGILRRMIAEVDVLIENFRPGTLTAMGLDAATIDALNERLVVVSISGFGLTGPSAPRALFDAIAQAEAGLMSVTGAPGGPPMLAGAFVADYIAAYHGVIAALAALQERDRSGRGQHVDIASVDALASTLGMDLALAGLGRPTQGRRGNRDPITAPANVFPAADGHVYIHAGTDPHFRSLCELIGRPELSRDERFASSAARLERAEEIEAEVARWSSSRDCALIVELMSGAGIPVGRVATAEDLLDSPQARERELLIETELAGGESIRLPGQPIKMRGMESSTRAAAPRLGEHNDWLYSTVMGYSEDDLRGLRDRGVI